MSSVVERSALPLGLSKTSREISPCASLSRDDMGVGVVALSRDDKVVGVVALSRDDGFVACD